ncbi:aminotransferase class IV [Candidatus Latescibacterota bacterium]
MTPDIWLDGEFMLWNSVCVHPFCHSLQRGATLFESIDCVEAANGHAAIFRLKEHILRLRNSSEIIRIPLNYTVEELTNAVIETVARSGLKACTIRPLAYYSDPVFDIYPGNSKVSVAIGLGERRPHKDSITMKISRLLKIDSLSMPIKAKVSGNYIAPMLAKSDAIQNGFDDTIILDHDGYVAEGATSNIFIVENGGLVTAPEENILQGITRDTVMELSQKLALNIICELFLPERLKQADEVFMCSSGMGVVPVTRVDDCIINDGKPGPVTKRLRSYYLEVSTGRVPKFENWLTYV